MNPAAHANGVVYKTEPEPSPPSPGSTPKEEKPKPKRPARQLTAQQLAKKRQNDREAQRAIRERTRTTIEALEKKVHELESGQAYSALQDVVHECDALRKENEELRQRLAQVIDLLQPVTAASAHPHQAPQLPPIRTQIETAASSPRKRTYSDATNSTAPSPQYLASAVPIYHPSSSSRDSSSHNDAHHHAKPSPASQHSPHWPSVFAQPGHAEAAAYAGPREAEVRTPLSPTQSLFRRQLRTSHSSMSSPAVFDKSDQPQYLRVPSHVSATNAFDTILLDLIQSCRERISTGKASVEEVLGPAYTDLAALLHPEEVDFGDTHYMSNVICQTLKGFSQIAGMPEKATLVAICAHPYCRWLIHPSLERFEQMCHYMRPTEDQLTIPHPIWIDILPWPALRDKLIHQHPTTPLQAFFFPYCQKLSINWDPNRDCLNQHRRPAIASDRHRTEPDGSTIDIVMTESLHAHAQHLENWSVGETFARTYPWLATCVRIREQP